MRQVPRIIPLLLLCTALGALRASGAGSATNLLNNGTFDSTISTSNFWYGVDSAGYLAGNRGSAPVLTGGIVIDTPMSVSVAVADMNGDGLPDILAMDPLGYLRIYFNSGTKTQPKFTIGELAPIYLSRPVPVDPKEKEKYNAYYMRMAPHISATKLMKTGKTDVLVGNYEGDIMLVPNAGSNARPVFNQPADPAQLFIATTSDKTRRWGNVLAPCTWDWNGDGKEDLLVGEGSYSANNVHLLINHGAGLVPAFDESLHYQIAYGDGKQQLAPCVVDYNGDGFPDLLIGDRSGHIGIYLNKGGKWKPGAELPFYGYIGDSGNPLSFGNICTVDTGDFHGSGLFDLVVGSTSGRVSMANNTGTKTEPKFSSPADISADKPGSKLAMPSGWDLDAGLLRGNFYGCFSAITVADDAAAQLPPGKVCLKAGYSPSQNKIMPPATAASYSQGYSLFNAANLASKGRISVSDNYAGDMNPNRLASAILRYAPANLFMARQAGFHLKAGAKYLLSMKIKGDHVSNAVAFIAWRGEKILGAGKIVRGDRGSATVTENKAVGIGFQAITLSPGNAWNEVKSEFNATFANNTPAMKDITDLLAFLEISFTLPPGQGSLYISDISLTPE